jgi:hypothetical protein
MGGKKEWANTAAWVRSRKFNRLKMLDTWFLTVFSVMKRISAISRLLAPVAMKHAKAKTQWNDSHPMLQHQAAQLHALRQRLTTL